MESKALLLRILYTINSSPQYILARSLSSVQVTPMRTTRNTDSIRHATNRLEFGTVSLKTCLDIICRSSPELVQDSRRDFSVYFLDPLESNSAPAPVNISNQPSGSQISNDSYEQPRGVAVGLGVMSLALLTSEKDSPVVTGTLIKLPTGQEALQVIFALQEMATLQKLSLYGGLSPWGQSSEQLSNSYAQTTYSAPFATVTTTSTSSPSYPNQTPYGVDVTTLATIASIQKRSQDKRARTKMKKPPKSLPLNATNSEADRLMLSEDVYVGPTRKKGRPSNAVASRLGCKNSIVEDSTQSKLKSTLTPVTAGAVLAKLDSSSDGRAHHTQPTKQPLSNDATAFSGSTPSTNVPADQEASLSILSYISALSSSGDPNARNAALLAVLNAIDSISAASPSILGDNSQNPTLVDALRHLLSAVSRRSQPAPDSRDSQHPPIVRHRMRSPDDDIVLLDKENVNPTSFRRRNERDAKLPSSESSSLPAVNEPILNRSLSIRSNGSLNTSPIAPAPINAATNRSGVRRKRTLSDFMDERESKNRVDKRDTHRCIYSSPTRKPSPATHRHYPRLVSDGSHVRRKSTNSYYRTGMVFWTSPPRPTEENAKTSHEREKSREKAIDVTDSPEPPRFAASSPARPIPVQSQVRRKYVIPAWARTETSTQPRLSEEAQRALELAEARKREEKEAKKRNRKGVEKEQKKRQARTPSPSQGARNVRQNSRSTTQAIKCPPPVTVASDCPVFAITSAIQDRVAAFMSSSDPPRPPSPQSSTQRSTLSPCTPLRMRHADLFTPDVDGSLFTPLLPEQTSNLLGSTRSPLEIGQRKTRNINISVSTTNIVKDRNGASAEDEDDSEEALSQELSMALEDLDNFSPQSTISNEDTIRAEMRSFTVELSQAEGCKIDFSKKQHWEGLPPSSPPPPTSPLNTPQDEESDALSDDMELPAANSDPEPYPSESEIPKGSYSSTHYSTLSDDDDVRKNDLPSSFHFSDNQTIHGSDAEASVANALSQIVDHNANFDVSTATDADLGILNNNELLNLDSAEFWETFNSLLHNQSGEAVRSFNSEFFQSPHTQLSDMMDHDHVRLAEDVQALFSGCLM